MQLKLHEDSCNHLLEQYTITEEQHRYTLPPKDSIALTITMRIAVLS